MTKKHTKRALFTSALVLLLCLSMLVGTTFAWFTDSVTTGRNTISSGNLDVVLQYKTDWDDDWADVTENTKLFKEGALYEPGYTEVVFLRVANAGSLALKYNLNVTIYGETTSTNVAGEPFSLKDYLEIGYYAQDEYSSGANYADILMPGMFGTREAALSSVTTTKLSADTGIIRADAPVLVGEQTSQVIALVLTMPTTVGNEANHQTGVAAPTIDLGINLVATQFTHEEDSFDNQYDKDAEYPEIIPTIKSYEDLVAAMKEGGEIVLGADITIPATGFNVNWNAPTTSSWAPVFAVTKDTTIDLNGFDITLEDYTGSANPAIFRVMGANLTIKGDGDITMHDATWITGHSNAVVNIEGGNWVSTNGGNDAIMMYHYSKINISGGTFNTSYYNIVNYQWDHHDYQAKITGGSFANWNPSNTYDYLDINNTALGKTMLADGYTVTSEVVDGITWYTVVAE